MPKTNDNKDEQEQERAGAGTAIVSGPSRAYVGRPTGFSPEIGVRIADLVKAGKPLEYAAAHVGVGRSTVYEWLVRGRESEEGELFEFYRAVAIARDELETTLVDRVKDGRLPGESGEFDWKASAWLLERINPARYGARVTVQVKEVLDVAIAELKREFAGEPAVMRRVFAAIVRAVETGSGD